MGKRFVPRKKKTADGKTSPKEGEPQSPASSLPSVVVNVGLLRNAEKHVWAVKEMNETQLAGLNDGVSTSVVARVNGKDHYVPNNYSIPKLRAFSPTIDRAVAMMKVSDEKIAKIVIPVPNLKGLRDVLEYMDLVCEQKALCEYGRESDRALSKYLAVLRVAEFLAMDRLVSEMTMRIGGMMYRPRRAPEGENQPRWGIQISDMKAVYRSGIPSTHWVRNALSRSICLAYLDGRLRAEHTVNEFIFEEGNEEVAEEMAYIQDEEEDRRQEQKIKLEKREQRKERYKMPAAVGQTDKTKKVVAYRT